MPHADLPGGGGEAPVRRGFLFRQRGRIPGGEHRRTIGHNAGRVAARDRFFWRFATHFRTDRVHAPPVTPGMLHRELGEHGDSGSDADNIVGAGLAPPGFARTVDSALATCRLAGDTPLTSVLSRPGEGERPTVDVILSRCEESPGIRMAGRFTSIALSDRLQSLQPARRAQTDESRNSDPSEFRPGDSLNTGQIGRASFGMTAWSRYGAKMSRYRARFQRSL